METYCRELVHELRRRVDLDLFALPGRSDGRPPSVWSLARFGFKTAFALLHKSNDCDAVHGSDLAVWPLVWIAKRHRPGIRPVLSAHGTDIAFAHRSGLLPRLYAFYLGCGAWLLPSVVILANSQATASLCKKSGFLSIEVVHLAGMVGEANIPSPAPFVLFVGRLLPRKGCAWFIHNVLPNLKATCELVIAGTVWDERERTALADPHVDFRGQQDHEQLIRLCQTATAVVVPNIDMGIQGFEGFGLSALEAAAAGGVVLASRLHGLTDAIIDGVTGFLLPANDADAWVTKIEDIQRWTPKERRAFIERSLDVIARSYSWSRVAEETIAAYRLNGPPARNNGGAIALEQDTRPANVLSAERTDGKPANGTVIVTA